MTTSRKIETRIGTIEFTHDFANGYPTDSTIQKLYDERDFQRACQAYLWSLPAVAFTAWQRGTTQQLGAKNGQMVAILSYEAMAMRMTGIGSQYLLASVDANKNYFDGSKTYKVTLPKGIPEANFWSLTLYDNQSRSMLDTPQRYPRAGSQSYPSPAAQTDTDGSTTVYFSPTKPDSVNAGNWIQTDPKKGWFTILRLYSPLEPFFTKEWRPSEIEEVAATSGRGGR